MPGIENNEKYLFKNTHKLYKMNIIYQFGIYPNLKKFSKTNRQFTLISFGGNSGGRGRRSGSINGSICVPLSSLELLLMTEAGSEKRFDDLSEMTDEL